MTCILKPHSDSPHLPVEALTATPRRLAGGKLEVVYRMVGDLGLLAIPELSNPERADELWKHTCFEIFILKADGPGYLEFNFAPTGQWAAYSFRTRRSGMQNIAGVAAAPIGTMTIDRHFVLRAEVDLSHVEGLPPADATWRAAISTIIETADGRKAYWAVAHPAGNPDFHAPEGYVVELPAPVSEG
jgi:hypothetical protein